MTVNKNPKSKTNDGTEETNPVDILNEQLDFLSGIIEAVPVALYYKDEQGIYRYCNRAFEVICGLNRDDIIGRTAFDLTDYEWAAKYEQMDKKLFEDPGEQIFEGKIHDNQGIERDVVFHKALYSSVDGSERGIIGAVIDINDRQKTEAALAESEERYRILFNNGNDAMFVYLLNHDNTPGKFVEINDAACQRLGYSREEMLLMSPIDIAFINDLDSSSSMISSLLENSYAIFETVYTTKEGQNIPIEVNSHLFQLRGCPAVYSIARDITKRKQTEEALRLSEKRFVTAFSCSPSLMSITSFTTGEFIEINDSFLRLTGYTREEVIGQKSLELGVWNNPEDRAVVRPVLYEQGAINNLEVKFYTKAKEPRKGLFSAEIFDVVGEKFILTVINDITDREQMIEEMTRLDRLNIVGEMAAAIGHEIRNPMTTVRGMLQLMGESETRQDYNDKYALMIEELDRANSIIVEFLSFAKDKAVQDKVRNLNEIIRSTLPLMQADAIREDKNVVVDCGDIPDILLDEKEIRQLILNLVRNARESMQSGGTVTVRTKMDANYIVMSVEDQGQGISTDVIEKIGTPFFTTKPGGTGLGLAVCYSIAARHHAAIKFKTGDNGTTFSVLFPNPTISELV
ncbi:MAG: PAS domain S-box protein [Acidobacteriota bacterium]